MLESDDKYGILLILQISIALNYDLRATLEIFMDGYVYGGQGNERCKMG